MSHLSRYCKKKYHMDNVDLLGVCKSQVRSGLSSLSRNHSDRAPLAWPLEWGGQDRQANPLSTPVKSLIPPAVSVDKHQLLLESAPAHHPDDGAWRVFTTVCSPCQPTPSLHASRLILRNNDRVGIHLRDARPLWFPTEPPSAK